MPGTSAGTTIGASAVKPATFTEAGYSALTFTNIGEVTNLNGDIGPEANLVTYTALQDAIVRKLKGSINHGALDLEIALDPDDVGQAAMETAAGVKVPYYFKVEFEDGEIRYFPALVMSAKERLGGADDVKKLMVKIEITAPGVLKA